ncbi:hypothetical protein GCM10025876_01300 [Demequina litorisediminis]|uniref:Uncharacterized protein n=1 Tax=Demequina litorisediminis TaxID=1849022 RepID=A0ABQ6I894_9MICO|nr:hypothetical protein [Demequina litorisediminis]GMA33926.1 hypothetical protein GCM10025876_01300 [Demequina litorisediminis]
MSLGEFGGVKSTADALLDLSRAHGGGLVAGFIGGAAWAYGGDRSAKVVGQCELEEALPTPR